MKQHLIATLAVAALAIAPAAQADRHGERGEHGEMRGEMHRDWGGAERHEMRGVERHEMHGWGGERDIRHFGDRHFTIWRGGHWHHGEHEGRLGWWWITAGIWYFYPYPVYPYPDPYLPPVVVVPPSAPEPPIVATQPQPQNWYYCEASRSYYPYVSSCPSGWKTVPATPAGKAPE